MTAARPDTWMPWYPGDFLRDTMHLNAEEDGAYRRLIDACWLRGGLLAANDERFSSITKLPMKRWLAVKPTIAEFFQVGDDGWRHKRVSEELSKAAAITEQRRSAGHASVKARSQRKVNGSAAEGQREINGCSTPVAVPLASPLPRLSRPSQPPLSVPNGTGGKPPPDPVKALFDSAVQVFLDSGKRSDEARAITGRLRKYLGDTKAAETVKAAHGKTDPSAYIMRILNDEIARRDRQASEVAPL